MNKKIIKVIYGIIIVLLGIIIYFTAEKKFKSGNNQQDINNFPATSQAANWKTYSNIRYAYTIKYPDDWFIDTTSSEKDFTKRGPINDLDFIGGDTTWSNYQNPRQYNHDTIPHDIEEVYLIIYRIDGQTTLDNFINSKNFTYSEKKGIVINGVNGIQLVGSPEFPKIIIKHVLLRVGNKVFNFSHAGNSEKSAMIMDQMLQTFRVK